MASNSNENVINKDNVVLQKSSSADRSITISDPVQVSIQVLTSGQDGTGKQAETATSTAAHTINNLVSIVEQFTSPGQDTITITDPVKVTITVVQASKTASPSATTTAVTSDTQEPLTTSAAKTVTPSADTTSTTSSTAAEKETPTVSLGAIATTVTTPSKDEHSSPATTSATGADTEPKSIIGAITENVAAPSAGDHSAPVTTSTISAKTEPSQPTDAQSTPTTIGAITESVATPSKDDLLTSATTELSKGADTQSTPTTIGAITQSVATPSKDDHSKPVTTEPSKGADTQSTPSIIGAVTNTVTAPAKDSPKASQDTETAGTTAAPSTGTQSTPATPTTPSTAAQPTATSTTITTTTTTISSTGAESSTTTTVTTSPTSSTPAATTTTTATTTTPTTATTETKPESGDSSSSSSGDPQSENKSLSKGNAKNLTDYQRKKAEYFFNVNLDKDNKKSLSWKDVEDYLLFHVDTAGKVGADDGAVEAGLSRGARDIWEHAFDQSPSADGKRESLTLDQFLDTWAGLVDSIVKNGQLPPSVQNLVDQGLDLYGTKDKDSQLTTVPAAAFDKLFKNSKLDPALASVAYTALTDNGTKPLDRDRLTSLVRAVIASSDDSHPSKYLLPGFVKDSAAKGQSDQPNQGTTPSTPTTSTTTSSTTSTSTTTPTTTPSTPATATTTTPSTPTTSTTTTPSTPTTSTTTTPSTTSTSTTTPSKPTTSTVTPSKPTTPATTPSNTQNNTQPSQPANTNQKQDSPARPSVPQSRPVPVNPRQVDDDVRKLLRFYGIADADVVEIDDGPQKRLVAVHPGRPLPAHVEQNKELANQLKTNGSAPIPARTSLIQATASSKPQEEVGQTTGQRKAPTLEERVASGDAKVGPTVPAHVEEKDQAASSTNLRQVSSSSEDEKKPAASTPEDKKAETSQVEAKAKPSEAPAEGTVKASGDSVADVSTTTPVKTSTTESVKESAEAPAKSPAETTTAAQPSKEPSKGITTEEEEKIVANIITQVTPLVEELVAREIRKLKFGSGANDNVADFIPFPMMFATSGPMFGAPSATQRNQGQFRGQQTNNQGGRSTDNFQGAGEYFPPEMFMSMANGFGAVPPGNFDPRLAGANSRASTGPSSIPRFPSGVEGFMMFVDDNSNFGGSMRGVPRP